ncbi:hypothetical protein TWF569_001899 [Orbilia oligospora]|uniref:Zn(2)-C6 fungal-type domain-containing protein n=1 Tax=Orbilia oligospora TaxID=2813651 RepID=A0A7C8JNX4_ORBOL|nr:hypothetical protein TWF102_002659 [Orbilia oligospora]KAF3153588.1 hypothetical protein TWF569_001899 [Orbilia oligospora]
MPPRSNTTCWRCRHDRQGCVRDLYDPVAAATCERCRRYKYTCTLGEPTEGERQGRILDFYKCSYCRDARQKCVLQTEIDPVRCVRCVRKDLPCSERTSKKHLPRQKKGPGSGGGSSGGSQGGDFTEGDSNSPDYDPFDEDEAGYQEDYSYQAGPSVNQHFEGYCEGYSQYNQYPDAGYVQGSYHQASYSQPNGHPYGQPQYGYNGY